MVSHRQPWGQLKVDELVIKASSHSDWQGLDINDSVVEVWMKSKKRKRGEKLINQYQFSWSENRSGKAWWLQVFFLSFTSHFFKWLLNDNYLYACGFNCVGTITDDSQAVEIAFLSVAMSLSLLFQFLYLYILLPPRLFFRRTIIDMSFRLWAEGYFDSVF